jgi:hypothetical protein
VLDRLRALSYIAAGALLAGCPRPLTPLVTQPLAAAPEEAARAWARSTVPTHATAVRFRFDYRDPRRRWGGHGTARIAPPDSLRFDYTGPLGMGSGAAVVVGDSVMWADPEENFHSLVPAIPMLWAALGVVRPPADSVTVERGQRAGGAPGTIWRFIKGPDTLDYVVFGGALPLLEAEWRKGGKILARSRTQFDARARPATARIDFPEAPARFDFSVVATDTAAVFAPAIWRSRR